MKSITIPLGELLVNFDNKRVPLSSRERESKKGSYPYYGATSILSYVDEYIFDGTYILLGEDGTVINSDGSPVLQIASGKFWCNNHAHVLKNTDKVDFYFLYYLLKNCNVRSIVTGAVQPKISQKNLNSFLVTYPEDKVIQKKIAHILGIIDSKISLNQKQNNNLEQQAQVLIQEHIINLQAIVPLDEFCNIFTGRKNANEFDKNGVNKFFTCGPEALSINSYIYDGPAVIISGNGAYTGRTRFYNGRFDLYQRTYACTLKEKVNSNYIYLLYPLLKMVLEKKLMGGTHGSAIPYIVMNDIAKFEVPFDKEIFDKISPACKAIIDKIQTNEQENEKLAEMRDALLPKLMSGEIDVSKVKINEILDDSLTDKLSFTGEE